jgi:hypothetical protein
MTERAKKTYYRKIYRTGKSQKLNSVEEAIIKKHELISWDDILSAIVTWA